MTPPSPCLFADEAAVHLHAVPDSAQHARSWASARAEEAGACTETTWAAELLTSELVTNAIKYGPSAGLITVWAECVGNELAITVSDEGDLPPVVCAAEPEDLGGRGLHLVQALANTWGVELHTGSGKSVWFRLTLDVAAA